MSAEDVVDVHYKGLWHKVIRVWLYDLKGNIYLRVKKPSKKCDFINELHIESGETELKVAVVIRSRESDPLPAIAVLNSPHLHMEGKGQVEHCRVGLLWLV